MLSSLFFDLFSKFQLLYEFHHLIHWRIAMFMNVPCIARNVIPGIIEVLRRVTAWRKRSGRWNTTVFYYRGIPNSITLCFLTAVVLCRWILEGIVCSVMESRKVITLMAWSKENPNNSKPNRNVNYTVIMQNLVVIWIMCPMIYAKWFWE